MQVPCFKGVGPAPLKGGVKRPKQLNSGEQVALQAGRGHTPRLKTDF